MSRLEAERTLKIRSESADIKSIYKNDPAMANSSLPRGEYLQGNVSPKMNKNLVKLKPMGHKNSMENDESFDGSLQHLDKLIPLSRTSSTTSDTSQASSDEGTPKGKKLEKRPSIFSQMKMFDTNGNPVKGDSDESLDNSPVKKQSPQQEQTFTPKVTSRKGNLYKISIIQNASKFSPEKVQPGTATSTKSEDAKKDMEKRFSLDGSKDASELRSALAKSSTPGSFSSAVEDKKPESTMAVKNLAFGVQISEKILKKHLNLILRGLNYSLKLLKPPPMSYIESRQIVLKELKKKTKTLVLDLDETLITSCSMRDEPDKVLTPIGGEMGPPIIIKLRPFVREFLKKMKEHYEILVFTAATSIYAETIVKELDPEKKYISYILDRSFCLETKNGFYIKDLRIIKNRELKNMIIIDNLVHSFGFQVENGVPIIEWTGNKQDTELKYLQDYLIEAKKYDDVREYNKQRLRLVELANSNIEEVMDI